MKYIFLLLLVVLGIKCALGQDSTELLASNIKLLFYSELEGRLFDSCELDAFCGQRLEITRLESKGFNNLVFYSIPYQPLTDCPVREGRARVQLPHTPAPCGYIVAFHTTGNRVYRVSGFRHNDVSYLLDNRSALFEMGYKARLKRIFKTVWIEGCDVRSVFDE